MGLVGCYTIDLYCDHPHHEPNAYSYGDKVHDWPRRYTGQTESECIRKARLEGWSVNTARKGGDPALGRYRCLCPIHSGK